jgi:riboflavin biosynthesis pyrimidine reductase
MILTISPILIGGEKAPSFFEGRGIESLKAACRFRKMSHFELDRDLILEGYF